ncbi:MAG: DoxX family protein [Bacteroidota bacterium]|nr:DoxX family protein [Bacteroidota bacterium]
MNKFLEILSSICRVFAAIIMLQTLYFKFTASPESVYIFTTIGMEPWGRIGIGIMELIASILLFIPSKHWLGAALGINLMAGALFFHITKLGFEVMGDQGQLVYYAITVLVTCSVVLFLNRSNAIFDTISLLNLVLKKKENAL